MGGSVTEGATLERADESLLEEARKRPSNGQSGNPIADAAVKSGGRLMASAKVNARAVFEPHVDEKRDGMTSNVRNRQTTAVCALAE